MKLKLSRGAALTLLAAGAAAGLFLWLAPAEHAEPNDDLVAVKHRPSAPRLVARDPGTPSTADASGLDARMALLSQRSRSDAEITDLFGVVSNKPAPPPPPPPPKPTAPPFPYTILGSLLDGNQRTVFLFGADRVIAVKPDQVIDGIYHVDQTDGSQLVVTYMPLHQQQVVQLGRLR